MSDSRPPTSTPGDETGPAALLGVPAGPGAQGDAEGREANSVVSALPTFVHTLSSGLSEVDVDPMTQAEQDEVDRRCEELRAHRAQAEVSGRDYVIV